MNHVLADVLAAIQVCVPWVRGYSEGALCTCPGNSSLKPRAPTLGSKLLGAQSTNTDGNGDEPSLCSLPRVCLRIPHLLPTWGGGARASPLRLRQL